MKMSSDNVVIVGAARTPIGMFNDILDILDLNVVI